MDAPAAGGGGGQIEGTPGPMNAMASQLQGQAQQWSSAFAAPLPTCGNPKMDGAIAALGGQFASATAALSGATSHTATFVSTTSDNFNKADGK